MNRVSQWVDVRLSYAVSRPMSEEAFASVHERVRDVVYVAVESAVWQKGFRAVWDETTIAVRDEVASLLMPL